MGTRGSIGFRLDGVDHLVYNHFDSYPSCLGLTMASFIVNTAKALEYDGLIGDLKQRVRSLVPVSDSTPPTEQQKKWLISQGLCDTEVASQSTDDWYCLLRNAQGDPEKMLQARFYEAAPDFVNDSLFCEYAYIINLDDETLEVYSGFQELDGKRKAGRYWAAAKKLKPHTETHTRSDGSKYDLEIKYGPVALALVFPLQELVGLDPAVAVDRMERATKEYKDWLDGSKTIQLIVDHDGQTWLMRKKDGARIAVPITYESHMAWCKTLPHSERRSGSFGPGEHERCCTKRMNRLWKQSELDSRVEYPAQAA